MMARAAADHLPEALKSSPEVGSFWVVKRKGVSIVLFQVDASGEISLGQSQRPLLGPQVEGSRDEVSKPFSWPPGL